MMLRCVALTVALTLATPAFAGRLAQPDIVEDALAFALTDRSKAAQLLEDALANEPNREDRDILALHAGEHRRLLGHTDQARAWFSRVLANNPKSKESQAASLAIVLLDGAGSLSDTQLKTLEKTNEKFVLSTQNADRYLILASEAARTNDATKVGVYTKKALTWSAEDPEVEARVKTALRALVADSNESPMTAGPSTSTQGTPLEQAEEAWKRGDAARAKALATKVAETAATDSDEARVAKYLLRRIDAGADIRTNKVAVLLPLSGKYLAAGRQVREAIEFGYRQAGGNRQLVFVDTGATPEGAVAALEKAVLEDKVIAVVGPLLTDETEATLQAASALRVPTVSISQANEDSRPFVAQAVATTGDQVEALVRHMINVEDKRRFGVFAPDSAYGHRAEELFKAAAEKHGGEVTISTFYDAEATTLLPFAQQFGQKDVENRGYELRELRKQAEENGRDPSSVVLPPVLDFDAIFLPDNAARIPLAAAALAYEEFPMGDFKPHKDSPFIPLLGLNAWNNDALVTRGGEYVRQARFTDVFFAPDANDPFVTAYQAELGRSPSSLEAAAADAAALLAVASKTSASTRPEFYEALKAANVDQAATGLVGISPEDGRPKTKIRVLTISRDSIDAVDTPENPGE